MDEDRELHGNESEQDSAKLTSIGDAELSDATEHGTGGDRLRLEGQPGDTAGSQPDTGAALVWSLVLSVLKFERGAFQRIGSGLANTKQAIAVYGIADALAVLASLFQSDHLEEMFAVIDSLAVDGVMPPIVVDFYRFLGDLDRGAALPLIMISGFAIGIGFLLARVFTLKSLFWLRGRQVPTFRDWFVAFAFASAPNPLSAVPIVGTPAATVYIALLEIAAIRELARISIGKAVLYWLALFLLVGTVIVVAVLVSGFASLTGPRF
ncbi:MAG: hypothetical protein F4X77_15585 [Acidobacteriia bacterium]|nr:hypothetical protein [Terriglobia bacterium]